MLTYQVEAWKEYWVDAQRLWQSHWREIALDQEKVPLDVDLDAYAMLDANGLLHIMTIRDGGTLVGYHLAILRPHLHYKSTLHAFTDVYYVLSGYRKGLVGYRLFQRVEDSLKALGVQKIVTGTKLLKDMSALFARLGYQETERLWTKLL